MNDIVKSDLPEAEPKAGVVERIDNGGRLLPGEYWRAKRRVEMKRPEKMAMFISMGGDRRMGQWIDYTADAGETMLVVEVRKSGHDDHTVVLAGHPAYADPRDRCRILVGEFLEAFEPVDGVAIRAAEMAGVRREIDAISADLTRAGQDEAYLNTVTLKALAEERKEKSKGQTKSEQTLPARPQDMQLDVLKAESPSLSGALEGMAHGGIVHVVDQVRTAQEIAEARGRWFTQRTNELQATAERLTPYYLEQAQVGIARASGAIAQSKRLMESITTLTLFTGDNVSHQLVRDGSPATDGSPIRLYEAKRWADEEMSYLNSYVDGHVDADMKLLFASRLKKDMRLVEQIIPSPRGVVLIGLSRQRSSHEEALTRALTEEHNAKSLLMVRDGERVTLLSSNVDSLEAAECLFPAEDVDGKIFRGINGADITPEDLRFTDHLTKLQKMAVMYRRFAVVIAGCISRGVFFESTDWSLLFTGEGNNKVFEYVRDATGSHVLGVDLESVDAYMERMNAFLRGGSRVAVQFRQAMNSDTAPQCFSESQRDGREMICRWPKFALGLAVAERDGTAVKVGCEDAHRDSRFLITLAHCGRIIAPKHSFLVVDRIDAGELDRLMRVRAFRSEYPQFMDLFRIARDGALKLSQLEAPFIARMAGALKEGRLADDAAALAIARSAIRLFRDDLEAGKGEQAYERMLALAYRLTDAGRIDPTAVESAARCQGIDPLRLVVDEDARSYLFAAPRQVDDRGAPHEDMDRYRVLVKKAGVVFEPLQPAAMYQNDPALTPVHQWPGADATMLTRPPFLGSARKARLIGSIEQQLEDRRQIMGGPLSDDAADRAIEALREHFARELRRPGSGTLRLPEGAILPFGLVTGEHHSYVLLAQSASYLACVYRHCSDAKASELLELYRRQYRNPNCSRVSDLQEMRGTDVEPFSIRVHAVSAEEFEIARPWAAAYKSSKTLYKIEKDRSFGRPSLTKRHVTADDACLALVAKTLTYQDFSDSKLETRTRFGDVGSEDITRVWVDPRIDLSRPDGLLRFICSGKPPAAKKKGR